MDSENHCQALELCSEWISSVVVVVVVLHAPNWYAVSPTSD